MCQPPYVISKYVIIGHYNMLCNLASIDLKFLGQWTNLLCTGCLLWSGKKEESFKACSSKPTFRSVFYRSRKCG